MTTITVTPTISSPIFVGRAPVDRTVANFFAPRLAAAARDGDREAREVLIAAREIAHASKRGARLLELVDLPEKDIERVIGVRLPREADTAFRLAMISLGLRGEDL